MIQILFNRTKKINDIIPPLEIKQLIFMVKKLLPDLVFNMASLEDNPFTYPEVQTLLEGITIGGHKLSDEQQILRIKEAWELIFKRVNKDTELTMNSFNEVNSIVAKDEALISGSFRTGQVRIAGTDYLPPKAEDLEKIFNEEINIIVNRCSSKTELAFEIFLWGALNQFYYDGNKRTSRLMANEILMRSGQGFFSIKVKDRLEFNTLMIDFYNTREADLIMDFFYNKCLER